MESGSEDGPYVNWDACRQCFLSSESRTVRRLASVCSSWCFGEYGQGRRRDTSFRRTRRFASSCATSPRGKCEKRQAQMSPSPTLRTMPRSSAHSVTQKARTCFLPPNFSSTHVRANNNRRTSTIAAAIEAAGVPHVVLLSDDDAIRIANDSIWPARRRPRNRPVSARRVATQLRAGRVVINGMTDDPQAPWGGFKFSGVGREYGRYGIEAFLEPGPSLRPKEDRS